MKTLLLFMLAYTAFDQIRDDAEYSLYCKDHKDYSCVVLWEDSGRFDYYQDKIYRNEIP
jgi:hypothetical protein